MMAATLPLLALSLSVASRTDRAGRLRPGTIVAGIAGAFVAMKVALTGATQSRFHVIVWSGGCAAQPSQDDGLRTLKLEGKG